jgi:hypothetical protein
VLKTFKEVEQEYDGNGHPLIINSTRRIETPPAEAYIETKYQIWSSVMNTTLTEMRENGSKTETKVFAGGAVIAKQYDNPQTPDFVRWLHADPVTGSRQEVQKNGIGEDWLRTEIEPLGQEIQPIKPDEEFPTGVTASNFSADSPEWLCQNPNVNYDDMPVGCQRAKNEDVTKFMFPEEEGNVVAITGVDSPMTPMVIPFMDSPVGGKSDPNTLALRESASATTKPTIECPAGTVPMKDAEGNVQCVATPNEQVRVDGKSSFPSTVESDASTVFRSTQVQTPYGKYPDIIIASTPEQRTAEIQRRNEIHIRLQAGYDKGLTDCYRNGMTAYNSTAGERNPNQEFVNDVRGFSPLRIDGVTGGVVNLATAETSARFVSGYKNPLVTGAGTNNRPYA